MTRPAERLDAPTAVVGQSVRRRDLIEKVTGKAVYTVDVTPPGTLHARAVRSTYAHARIAHVDVTAAEASPGVVRVITSADLAGLFPRFGHIVADHCILAIDRVRYYGEPVALVIAQSRAAAEDAAELVVIDYDELPAVLTAAEALAPAAILVHDETYQASADKTFAETAESDHAARSNVCASQQLQWGDVDSAFARAALVLAGDYRYPMLYAYAMEPYNAVATFTGESLHVVSSAQHPFMVRTDLARVFGLPLSRVRVEAPYLGGGYGSKSYTKVEPLAAIGAWATGRTVKLVLDVEEAIYTTRADAAEVHVRSAYDDNGTILAREFDIVLDSGAYADNSPLVLEKAVVRCFGPYRVPNLRVRGRSVYTNTSPASSYRGFGAPLGVLAGELNLDEAAMRLGLDPVEMRRRNLLRPGEEILPGKRGLDADLLADLELVRESLALDAVADDRHALGFGCAASDAGAFPVSTAQVRIQTDGSAVLLTGSTVMGQGSRSALAQIAAEELGISIAEIDVVQSDTAAGPYERTTGASRTTTLTGLAVQRACADARAKIVAMAAESLDVPAGKITLMPGGVVVDDARGYGYGEVIRLWFGADSGEVTGVGLVRRDGATRKMPPFWEVGVVGVEVEIDPELGAVQVRQLTTVGDVGFAINPAAVEGQDLGAATQGLGMALYEELVYDGPQLLNANLVDYRVPRMRDLPAKIDTILAQRRDGVGPYGAKGSGEGSLNPIGPAVASAIARVTGRWPRRIPLTPERVWRLINDRENDPQFHSDG
jgi:CO/xanthine dehydrogenase Mo-binding subunit